MLTVKAKQILTIPVLLVIVSFIVFNFKVFYTSPRVIIENFEKNELVVVENDKFILNGRADNSKNFYINGQEILLNTNFIFSKTLYLSKYQNIFNIKSIHKDGTIFEKKLKIYLK